MLDNCYRHAQFRYGTNRKFFSFFEEVPTQVMDGTATIKPLDPAKFRDPSVTADGSVRAVVALGRLNTLWINTGTLCNLTCANCYIESGFEKGVLIDFNYDVEPLPGKYPLPGFGPFSLLKESYANHWGKMMFRWMYWNILLKGGEMPFESQMSMAGKWQ